MGGRWVALAGTLTACSFEPSAVMGTPGDGARPGDGGAADGSLGGDVAPPTTDAGRVLADASPYGPCVVGIAAGSNHTCVLRRSGTVFCWGSDANGELGNGSGSGDALLPAQGVQVVSSKFHTCARLADGRVACWGLNADGQLGDGTRSLRTAPVVVPGIADAVDVSAGRDQTCVAHATGGVSCWGANGYGQLGDGTGTDRLEPTPVVSLSAAAMEVAAGSRHTCARLGDGSAACWGHNLQGQLGNGTTTGSAVPVAVSGLNSADRVVAGGWYSGSEGGYHSCALVAGTASCWGSNVDGQLGDAGASGLASAVPVQAEGISDASELAAGRRHTCALRAGGEAWCWGDNGDSQLGPDAFSDAPSPLPMSTPSRLALLTAGGEHTCAREGDGSVWCWGWNAYGQLGAGGGPGPVLNEIGCP